jgi:predicted amidohydrolase
MKAGFYQFNPFFGKKKENLKKVLAEIKDSDLELLVLPEFFATGYQFTSIDEVDELSETIPRGYTTEFLLDISYEKGIYIVAGLPERGLNKFYNSAILTGPNGLIGVYRKTHLFLEEKLYFAPGDTGFRVWNTKIGRIGIMICFDWFFPESIRTLAILDAEVVAHPANLVLPYCPQAMPIRCMENRVFAITANRIGVEKRKGDQQLKFIGRSQIVSPEGKVLIHASEDEEKMFISEINITLARNKAINQYNDIFNDRRPEMYSPLCKNYVKGQDKG